MSLISRVRTSATIITLSLGLAAPAALAQGQPELPEFTSGTVLVIDHADLRQFFPDERDQGLLRALEMVPARIRELPTEVGDDFTPEVASIINTIITALARPGRIAVAYDETPTGGLFGYGVTLSTVAQNKEDADTVHARVRAMLRQANPRLQFRPSQRFRGMNDLQLPFGILSMGPREAADGWRYEVILGTMPEPDAVVDVLPPAPDGITHLARAYFNARGLAPAIGMAQDMAGWQGDLPPQAAGFLEMVEQGLVTTWEAGYTQNAMVTRTHVRGARVASERLMVGHDPLTPADLRIIPVDATIAYMRRLPEGWASNLLETFAAMTPEVEEGFDEFERAAGVSLRELAATIGDRVSFYTSDTTGGGGLGSGVALVSVQDPERLGRLLSQLAANANAAAEREIGAPYVKVVRWQDQGSTIYSLRFPGVPVPLELTVALSEQWLVMSAIPQSAIAAARQIRGEAEGIAASPRLRGLMPGRPVVEFGFSENARSLAAGYPFLSMIGSGIANMVRSPIDPSRDPGLIIPLYAELAGGVRASVKMTYWNRDDLISESSSPRSMAVNLGVAMGVLGKFLPLAAAGAAAGYAADQGAFSFLDTGISPIPTLARIAMPLPDRIALRAAGAVLPPGEETIAMMRALLAPVQGAGK